MFGPKATLPSGRSDQSPPLSKAEYVMQRLRDEIERGVLNPGQPLRQADIAARYHVSPTPVREAFRLLAAEGVITHSAHRGATVAEFSPTRMEDLYLLRASIESLATRLTVERMGGQSLDEVREIHEKIRASVGAADARELAALNRELHFAIYRIGSSLISSHLSNIWRLFPPQVTLWQDRVIVETFVGQHDQIIRAMLEGDAERAASLMSNHILTASRFRRAQKAAEEAGSTSSAAG